MDYNQFYRIYDDLNISFGSLPENYNPEDYGRSLLANSTSERGVSYSSSTEYWKNNIIS